MRGLILNPLISRGMGERKMSKNTAYNTTNESDMKAMAFRLIKNKDPVMVIFGHYDDWNETELFWRIDECVDPNECEYLEFGVDQFQVGFMWPSAVQNIEDINSTELIEATGMRIFDVFDGDFEWTKININIYKK